MDLFKSTIIICSIVRDAEIGLRNNIPVIDAIGKYFQDYQVVVFENDSKDNTKLLLSDWQARKPKNVHCIMQNKNAGETIPLKDKLSVNPFFSKKRIAKMVDLRNQYMDYIVEHNMIADFLMVVDLDVAQLYETPIIEALKSDCEWDVISAYGHSTSPTLRRRYHDGYAVTLLEDADKPATEDRIRKSRAVLSRLQPKDDWFKVNCAFGGACIYRFEAVLGLKYSLLDNDDERVEVRCEHYSFMKQIHERGYNNVYVVPSMLLKYQRITFKSFWQKVLNRLKGNAV